MQVPLQVTFRGFDPTPGLEHLVRDRAIDLDNYHPRITACRVVVEKPHAHSTKGEVFRVRIDVTVPGREIVVERSAPERREHEHVEVAVRDAFDAARRKLQDAMRRRRGEEKHHEEPPTGRVVRLIPERNCGFIESEGREIYFHRSSVLDAGYGALEIGSVVRFALEDGEKGPQASTVHPRRVGARPRSKAARRGGRGAESRP